MYGHVPHDIINISEYIHINLIAKRNTIELIQLGLQNYEEDQR